LELQESNIVVINELRVNPEKPNRDNQKKLPKSSKTPNTPQSKEKRHDIDQESDLNKSLENYSDSTNGNFHSDNNHWLIFVLFL
jgi:hypothetical protein